MIPTPDRSDRFFPRRLRLLAGLGLALVAHPGWSESAPAGTPAAAAALPIPTAAPGTAVLVPETSRSYRVLPGDTLHRIARLFSVSARALQAANPNVDPRRLQPGTLLYVPPPEPSTPAAPADSFEARDVRPLNERILAAAGKGEAWVRDPLAVVLHELFPENASPESWEFGERRIDLKRDGDALLVTVETIGCEDDSVAAEKHLVRLIRSPAGVWTLESLRAGHRCWPGRGHPQYSADPCV